jgi:hypothetical protein
VCESSFFRFLDSASTVYNSNHGLVGLELLGCALSKGPKLESDIFNIINEGKGGKEKEK